MNFDTQTHFGYVITLAVAATAIFGATLASTLRADFVKTPLERAVQRSSDGPVYVYGVDYQSNKMVAQYTVDPTQPEGSRVTVHSPAKQDWSLEFIQQVAEMDEDASTNLLCSEFAANIPPTATLISESALSATYRFKPVPEDEDDEAVFPHLIGTVTVDKIDPAILSFEMYAPEPFSPHWILKISRMEFKVTCARLPDGRTHVQHLISAVEGLAALKSISENEQWHATSVHAVSP